MGEEARYLRHHKGSTQDSTLIGGLQTPGIEDPGQIVKIEIIPLRVGFALSKIGFNNCGLRVKLRVLVDRLPQHKMNTLSKQQLIDFKQIDGV